MTLFLYILSISLTSEIQWFGTIFAGGGDTHVCTISIIFNFCKEPISQYCEIGSFIFIKMNILNCSK